MATLINAGEMVEAKRHIGARGPPIKQRLVLASSVSAAFLGLHPRR